MKRENLNRGGSWAKSDPIFFMPAFQKKRNLSKGLKEPMQAGSQNMSANMK
jgi:hypothetical protein